MTSPSSKVSTALKVSRLSQALPPVPDADTTSKGFMKKAQAPAPAYTLIPTEEHRLSAGSSCSHEAGHKDDDAVHESAPLLAPLTAPSMPLAPPTTTMNGTPHSPMYDSAYESAEWESDNEETHVQQHDEHQVPVQAQPPPQPQPQPQPQPHATPPTLDPLSHTHQDQQEDGYDPLQPPPGYEPMHDYHASTASRAHDHAYAAAPPCPNELQQMQVQMQMMYTHLLGGSRRRGHDEPFIVIIDTQAQEEERLHAGTGGVHRSETSDGGNGGGGGGGGGGETPPPPYEAIFMQRGNALEVSGAVGLMGYDWIDDDSEYGFEMGDWDGERAEMICKWIICGLMLVMIVVVSVGSAVGWGQY